MVTLLFHLGLLHVCPYWEDVVDLSLYLLDVVYYRSEG